VCATSSGRRVSESARSPRGRMRLRRTGRCSWHAAQYSFGSGVEMLSSLLHRRSDVVRMYLDRQVWPCSRWAEPFWSRRAGAGGGARAPCTSAASTLARTSVSIIDALSSRRRITWRGASETGLGLAPAPRQRLARGLRAAGSRACSNAPCRRAQGCVESPAPAPQLARVRRAPTSPHAQHPSWDAITTAPTPRVPDSAE